MQEEEAGGISFLDSLNEEQRQAVTTTEGYVRVIAGAGSGKTRALTYRFAYLVNAIGIMPSHILSLCVIGKLWMSYLPCKWALAHRQGQVENMGELLSGLLLF